MQNRTITHSGQIIGGSRPDLSNKVNSELSQLNIEIAKHHARVINISQSTPQPYHLGNWTQTLTVTIEGDYDDPIFKEFYDDYARRNSGSNQQKTASCYVATAVYGSYDCPQVWTLRRYRDYTLAESWYGRAFIHIYYAISPTIVKLFGETKWFKKMWKGKLDHLVTTLQDKGFEATPYSDKRW